MGAKLQGDKSASQSFMELYYHGFLDPFAFPDFSLPRDSFSKTPARAEGDGGIKGKGS